MQMVMLLGEISLEGFITITTIYKEACFLYPYKPFAINTIQAVLN